MVLIEIPVKKFDAELDLLAGRQFDDDAQALFVAGAQQALKWLLNGAEAPSEFLDQSFYIRIQAH